MAKVRKSFAEIELEAFIAGERLRVKREIVQLYEDLTATTTLLNEQRQYLADEEDPWWREYHREKIKAAKDKIKYIKKIIKIKKECLK